MGFSPNNEAKIDDRPFLLKEEREKNRIRQDGPD